MSIIIVSGALANKLHNGGEAWVRLSWATGLRRLGHDVYFVEQIAAKTCVDKSGAPAAFEQSANLAYFRGVMGRFGFAGRSALLLGNGEACEGMDWPRLLDVAASAEVLVNISGHLSVEPVMRRVARRAYVDIDPGFTQFWHADPAGGFRLDGHDFYFTIGENIGAADCPIPTGGIRWLPVRQPVVLDDWPVTAAPPDPARFTTVASWRGPFGPLQFGGRSYGLKVHEFRKCLALPALAASRCAAAGAPAPRFEIALDIHPGDAKDRAALRDNGWHVTDPRALAADPDQFRRFVQGSGAEFSVAQGIYVDTHSGWFSDRTARYLASGRPALVQETGFSRHLPSGTGLVAFSSPEEAANGAARVLADYDHHARAARTIAAEFFDSDRVLARFLRDVGM
jgi:hypothetical protein